MTMTGKLYDILLDNKKIGMTELEKADTPMGVVFGKIKFINIISGYDFFRTYCLTNDIEIISDFPDDRFITTTNIPNLRVIDLNGIEIRGQGVNIGGMDSDCFEVTIWGVPYPFFAEEFPHHMRAYEDQFKDS